MPTRSAIVRRRKHRFLNLWTNWDSFIRSPLFFWWLGMGFPLPSRKSEHASNSICNRGDPNTIHSLRQWVNVQGSQQRFHNLPHVFRNDLVTFGGRMDAVGEVEAGIPAHPFK